MLPPLRTPDHNSSSQYHYPQSALSYAYKPYAYNQNHPQHQFDFPQLNHAHANPSGTSPSPEIFTPTSATHLYNTVHPSTAFGAWQSDYSRRASTVSDSFVGGDEASDRRPSASSLGSHDLRWDVKPSPGLSPLASGISDVDVTTPLPPLLMPYSRPDLDLDREGEVVYTTNSDVKQTAEVSVYH